MTGGQGEWEGMRVAVGAVACVALVCLSAVALVAFTLVYAIACGASN